MRTIGSGKRSCLSKQSDNLLDKPHIIATLFATLQIFFKAFGIINAIHY